LYISNTIQRVTCVFSYFSRRVVEFVSRPHWLSLFQDHFQCLGLLDVVERVWSHVVVII
jgi:hypothetical protein